MPLMPFNNKLFQWLVSLTVSVTRQLAKLDSFVPPLFGH